MKCQKGFEFFLRVHHFCSYHLTRISHKYNALCIPSYLSGGDDFVLQQIAEHFKVYEDFVSEAEEEELLKEIDPVLKRRRYENDHWDGAIKGYKEIEKSQWNEANSKILQRVRSLAFPTTCSQIKSAHVLDLSKDGYIKPHIDSIRFCGDTIAGISLLSSSIMRLVMEENKTVFIDVFLPRRSLYIMKGIARYNFTHEILEDSLSCFKGKRIIRDRRISVICRNEPTGS